MQQSARLVLFAALLAGLAPSCASPPPSSLPATSTHRPAPWTASPTAPPISTPTIAPDPTASPTLSLPALQVCPPLQGIQFDELSAIVSNPYQPPPLGSDDPHQGVDLAQVQNGIALTGMPVQAVLDGRAVLVVKDRFPYGNALLVETPLDSLPRAWLDALDLPSIPATPQASNALTCPTPAAPVVYDLEQRSLYLLYAHMLEPPSIRVGDPVACGQVIGAIGSSGNALNPHLHLEVRVGSSGARFPGMAHYDASASPEEMSAYCQWRVSGAFLHIDPLLLFATPEP